MEILSEFTIDGKKYCTVRTKGSVSVVGKWEYNNVVNKYMRNGGNKNGCSRNSNDGKRMEETQSRLVRRICISGNKPEI